MVSNLAADPVGRDLHQLVTLYPQPGFVKSASSEAIYGGEKQLPRHLYGDPRHCNFPCHTAAATWVSTGFLHTKKAQLAPKDFEFIDARLQKAAEYHGIGNECATLREKIAADSNTDPEQLPDEMFALVYRESGGTEKQRHMPLRNAVEVKTAAQYLQRYVDKFAWHDRQAIAQRVLSRAATYGADLGADLDRFLEKQAGYGVCSAADAVRAVRQRALLAANQPELRQKIEKIAATLEADPATTRSNNMLVKLANLLYSLDRTLDVQEYGEMLRRPEDVLFSVTEKVAKQFQAAHIPLLSGSVYKSADLANLRIDDLRSWMGDEIVDAVTVGGAMLDQEKLAAVLPTLPRPDAEMFDRYMTEIGVQPAIKEATAAPRGLSRQQLFELAHAHQA